MRVFILFKGERHCLDVNRGKTVAEMKELLRKKFDLDTVQSEDAENDMLMSLSYAGGILEDEWIFSDIGIAPGVTLRCELVENVKSYLDVLCVYSGEMLKFTEPFSVWETKVSEVRSMIMNKTGLHVSVFRIVTLDGKEMFDCNLLKDYNVNTGDTVRLETWNGWGQFLKAATGGQLTPTLKYMISLNEDPLVAKYQHRVALFIAAHFGYHQLAALLLKSGARSDEAVGEHPVREWCNGQVHLDHYKTPVHEAAQRGHINCLRLFIYHNYTCILVKDGSGLTPCNLARRHRQTECFKLLIAEQFRSRTIEGLTITIYARVKKWSERARDRAMVFHKHNPSPLLLAMEKRSYRSAVVGQKVQIDGFGRNLQTTASKIELSLVSNTAVKARTRALTGVSDTTLGSGKLIKPAKQHSGSLVIGERAESSGSDRELEDSSSHLVQVGTLQDTEASKQKTRMPNYSLPAVFESRFHREKSKQLANMPHENHSQANGNRTTRRHRKEKGQFTTYRWKEMSLNQKQEETEEITERLNSMPQIGGNGNRTRNKDLDQSQLHSQQNDSNFDTEITRNGEKDVFFVTEKSVDFQERPFRVHAWTPANESESVEAEHITTTNYKVPQKMPLIGTPNILQNPEEPELNQNKRWKRKDYSEAKSEGDTSDKHSLSTNCFPKRKSNGVLRRRAMSEDPNTQTTALYRHVTGLDIRESARASLDVAMTFNKKTWLQQVQLAIDLNANTFKRQILRPRNHFQKSV